MAPRTSSYFAWFDFEILKDTRNIALFLDLEHLLDLEVEGHRLTTIQRTTIKQLRKAMARSPIICNIIGSEINRLGCYPSDSDFFRMAHTMAAYVVAPAGVPGTAQYAEAQLAWETRQPLQATILSESSVINPEPLQVEARSSALHATEPEVKVEATDDEESLRRQLFAVKALRTPVSRTKSRVAAAASQLEAATPSPPAPAPPSSTTERTPKVRRAAGNRVHGIGSKQPWLESEKAVLIEMLRDQATKYRHPKFVRLTNDYNDRMCRGGVKQGPEEIPLALGKHKTLGRERTAPWRTVPALTKAVKSLEEYTAVTDSALPAYDPATQTEADPLAHVPGADDGGDDDVVPPPPFVYAAAPSVVRNGRSRSRAVDESAPEDEDAGQGGSKKKRQRRVRARYEHVPKDKKASVEDDEDQNEGYVGGHIGGPGSSGGISP